MPKPIRIILKALGWILLSILGLFALLYFVIQIPSVQNYLKDKAVHYVENKIHTHFAVGHFYLRFFSGVEVDRVYLQDQKKDTLLYADRLKIDISLLQLIGSKAEIKNVELEGVTTHITRLSPDTVFNYQYIINAFTTPDTTVAAKDTGSSNFSLNLQNFELTNIKVVYHDDATGNEARVALGHLQTSLRRMDLQKMAVDIPSFLMENTDISFRQYVPLVRINGDSLQRAAAKQTDTTQLALPIKVGSVDFKNIHFHMTDDPGAFLTDIQLGSLTVKPGKIDLAKMAFEMDKIELERTQAVIGMGKSKRPPEPKDTSAPLQWLFKVKDIGMNNVAFKYDDSTAKPIGQGMDYSHLLFKNVLLQGENIILNTDEYRGTITKGALVEKGGLTLKQLKTNFLYNNQGAYLGKLLLQANNTLLRDSVRIHYKSLDDVIKHPGEMELYAHLPNAIISAKDILTVVPMLDEYMNGYRNAVFKLNTIVKGKIKDLQVPVLEFSGMNNTYVKMKGYIHGLPDVNKLAYDLNIEKLTTSLKDIEALVPKGMLPPMAQYGNGPIYMSGAAKGNMNNVVIPRLELRALQNTYVNISGRADNMTRTSKAYFDIHIKKMSTSAIDIAMLAPKGTIPYDKVRIPKYMEASGYFKGGLSQFNTNLKIKTSNGNADVVGTLNQNGNYAAHFNLQDFNAGYIFRMDSIMGKLTFSADAVGSGLNLNKFDLNRVVSDFKADLQSADIYGYHYQNLTLDGKLDNGTVNANAGMNDPNIRFQLNATADLKLQYPALQLRMNLDTLVLHQLHILRDTVILKGNVLADFSNTNPDNLNGRLVLEDFDITRGMTKMHLDSFYFASKMHDSSQQMIIGLDSIVHIALTGRYKLTEMSYALENIINKYYSIPDYKPKKVAPQQYAINGYIVPKGILIGLLPEIRGSDSLTIAGSVNTNDSTFLLKANAPKIVYGGQQMSNAGLSIQTQNDSLKLLVGAANVKGKSFSLFGTGVRAAIANNVVDFGVGTQDSLKKTLYGLGGQFSQLPGSIYRLHLKDSGLVLNYDRWQTSPDNEITYDGKKSIHAKNFLLQTQGQSILLNSVSDSIDAPLDIKFESFRLSTLTHIANRSDVPIDGVLNGQAQLRNMTASPVFTADLTAKHIAYGKDTIGDFALKVDNEQGNDIYNVNALLTNNNNDASITGTYNNDNNAMDLKFLINQLNLHTVLPFSMGQLDSLEGILKANIAIRGTIDTPLVKGNLNFNNAYFTPTMTGATLRLSNENIEVDEDGIHFKRFTLRDANNNRFRINGDLLTKNFLDYRFALQLKADDFTIVNTPKADNRFFYGKLNLTTDMQVGGDMDAPVVNGLLHVNKATDFSMIMPSDDPEVEDRKGVVVFTDFKRPVDTVRTRRLTDSLSNNSRVKGMDISLTIETDTSARFALILDERTGDALEVRGDADLAFGIDQSGKMSLTGAYTLNSGSYQMSMPMLPNFSKKFIIQKGSTINWTGDPMSALVDITALYNVKAAPIDLMSQQLSGTDMTTYKQLLPFSVLLKLKEELLKPDISFDITLPSDYLSQWPLVDTKLQQIRTDGNELNKQVVALLLLGRFVGDNPLQSQGAATSIGDMARQNAGRLLSDQLNKLAGNLIQGIDLNFDLNSGTDYSTGQAQAKTDLNVKMTKRLFNDRIEVNVGSNFALEGTSANQQATNIAGDVSVGYKLSRDGRYLLRAYRKNQYEGVIQGQVVSTGLGFVLTLDYDRFKELFESAAKREARQNKNKRANNGRRQGNRQGSNKNKKKSEVNADNNKMEQK